MPADSKYNNVDYFQIWQTGSHREWPGRCRKDTQTVWKCCGRWKQTEGTIPEELEDGGVVTGGDKVAAKWMCCIVDVPVSVFASTEG